MGAGKAWTERPDVLQQRGQRAHGKAALGQLLGLSPSWLREAPTCARHWGSRGTAQGGWTGHTELIDETAVEEATQTSPVFKGGNRQEGPRSKGPRELLELGKVSRKRWASL